MLIPEMFHFTDAVANDFIALDVGLDPRFDLALTHPDNLRDFAFCEPCTVKVRRGKASKPKVLQQGKLLADLCQRSVGPKDGRALVFADMIQRQPKSRHFKQAKPNCVRLVSSITETETGQDGRPASLEFIYRNVGARFFPAPDDPWQGDREFED